MKTKNPISDFLKTPLQITAGSAVTYRQNRLCYVHEVGRGTSDTSRPYHRVFLFPTEEGKSRDVQSTVNLLACNQDSRSSFHSGFSQVHLFSSKALFFDRSRSLRNMALATLPEEIEDNSNH
ncbi:MAG: hypothetical protein ACLQM6_12920 [Acidobacteriaceae bacterium]